jgi:hypothetical protein
MRDMFFLSFFLFGSLFFLFFCLFLRLMMKGTTHMIGMAKVNSLHVASIYIHTR